MAVKVEEGNFYLLTKHTLYQMKVDDYGVLLHLWYGCKTEMDMEYLLDYPDVGFAGNLYEAGKDKTYSLNTLPQEYGTIGVGDFRIPAVSITHADGSTALDLRYQSHKVYKGKYAIPNLPAVHTKYEEADTLEITMKDTATDLRVVLKYGILENADLITRSAVLINDGIQPITINRAHSFCIDFPYGNWEWMHFHGRHAMELQAERSPLLHGIQESSSTRGATSHQHNPAVLLCEKDCTETRGYCMGAALLYSGSFQTQLELDQLNQVRIVMGIHPDTFSWELNRKESFFTPEVMLSCSMEGLGRLSRQFHKGIREHVCRGMYQKIERPILINNWEATYFDFDEEKLFQIAEQAANLGVDLFVLDDGWFGNRENDTSGLGDWFVNERKLKGGLEKLVERIHGLGMKFGIWFEPEMISEDSRLYREHPDWAIQIPGRQPMRSRYQLTLDFTRQEVRDYLYEAMSHVLRNGSVEYVKWDMNRSISDWYSYELSANRQSELAHRYVLGVYELLERLTTEFPNVLFEGCAGGGGRFDAGMLYYCPQIWCSDNTDAYERTKIQYGASFFYPISAVGSHVSAVPNHQTGRSLSLSSRGVVAMAGSFGYELDLNTLSVEEKEEVKEQICHFKQLGPLIHNGSYYRLSNPDQDKFAIWSYVSEDQKQVLVQGMIFHTEPNRLRYAIRLQGLNASKNYVFVQELKHTNGTSVEAVWKKEKLDRTNRIYTGKALMEGGILLPRAWGDYVPVEFYLEELPEKTD